ncbi:MAG: Fe-S cluster assembly protein SufD [Verrucomicrobia bacterium]|nr:Fe-S cluster assembly protein SufD [Verrucomicrobiota bacterium]MBV9674057.1 Fe-S cluster assembly protein SufD [Verrucomicrobiota bacterium]
MISTSVPSIQETASVDTPLWFVDQQAEARKEFKIIPQPARTDELWRYSSIKNLEIEGYGIAGEFLSDPAKVIGNRKLDRPAGRLIFANDRLVSEEIFRSDLLAKGLIFTSLLHALGQHSTLLQKHFMAQPVELGSSKFAALHKSTVSAGTFLHVPRGLVVDEPFEVFHLVDGDRAAIFPHTLIITDEVSSAILVEHFLSANDEQAAFVCGVNDLVLNPGSQLTYVSVQDWSRSTASVHVNSTVVQRDASALNLALNFGGKYSRLESVSRMIGQGARSDMLALSIAQGDQEFDQRTLQSHLQPNTTSDLLYKNALYDRARTIFSGLIKVQPGAHRTDAYQKVRNLMLSDEAEANSLPGLEILADDVRCTHGATSGQIEAEELFYLKSRGISDETSKALIVRGFLDEVVGRLKHKNLTDFLYSEIESHLRG